MSPIVRAALPPVLVAVLLAATPVLPSFGAGGPTLAPAAGVLVAAVLAGAWGGLLAALGLFVVLAVLAGEAPLAVLAAGLAPLAAAGASHLRRAHLSAAGPTSDPLEILGVAAGTALLSAALAGALGLAASPPAWALAQGLGVLVAAPPVARLLELLAPRQVQALPPPPPALQEPPPPGLRLLVVEDDPVNRLVAMELLRSAGHIVDSAAAGAEGLGRVQLAEPPYDAVILDLHMPGLDGVDALRRIRVLDDPARAGVPVILLSADVTEDARRRGMAAGADAFLTKPFEAATLLAALDGLHGTRGAPEDDVDEGELPDPVDLDLLESRLGDLGADSLGRILGLFQDAAPRHLARLREYAAAGDAVALRREAHTLKGAAAVIGARRVHDAAHAIEVAAGTPGGHLADLARLEGVIEAAMRAVEVFARQRNVPFTRTSTRRRVQETSAANT